MVCLCSSTSGPDPKKFMFEGSGNRNQVPCEYEMLAGPGARKFPGFTSSAPKNHSSSFIAPSKEEETTGSSRSYSSWLSEQNGFPHMGTLGGQNIVSGSHGTELFARRQRPDWPYLAVWGKKRICDLCQ